jgi:IS30 family transposase
MEYCHLTSCERSQIYALLSNGCSQRQIAYLLNKSPSTISREIKRNTGGRGYRPKQAQAKSEERRILASHTPKKMHGKLLNLIEEKLHLDWSPEQISKRLAASDILISHESIYLHVWKDKRLGGRLYTHLRHAGKKYHKRGCKKAGRGLFRIVWIFNKDQLLLRIKNAWGREGGTVLGAHHKGAVLSVVDRTSKFSLFVNLAGKTSSGVNKAIIERFNLFLQEYPSFKLKQIARTITFDNGKEFSGHEAITKALGIDCYFAKPYHSWERGLNEHTNGMICQYYPKKTDFTNLSEEKTQWIENRLNYRPRKVLDYMTPREVFMGKSKTTLVALRA